ncbi:MAG: SDR family oxidoreductase [Bacteroidota bacterium]
MSTKINKLCILGASSDLGEALAYRFAPEVKQLILSSRQPHKLEALKKDITIHELGPSVELITVDCAAPDEAKLQQIAQQTDLVICTIGYLGDHDLAQSDAVESSRIIQANYSGLVAILNIFARNMDQRGQGGMIGVASVAGLRGRQSNYLYGSAKAGFIAYLSGLRNRLHAKGIHVMTVLPGFMDTQMTAHLDLPPLLTAQPKQAADRIYKAYRRRKNQVYVLGRWRWIMLVITSIPEFIFKRLRL